MTDYVEWLANLAAEGGKGTVDNIDARSLGKAAHELEYLLCFFQNADFGPAHEDVVSGINEYYVKETGHELPEGFGLEE